MMTRAILALLLGSGLVPLAQALRKQAASVNDIALGLDTAGKSEGRPESLGADGFPLNPKAAPDMGTSIEQLVGGTHPEKLQIGGQPFVRKSQHVLDWLFRFPNVQRMEAATNSIINVAGAIAPHSKYYAKQGIMISKFMEGLSSTPPPRSSLRQAFMQQLGKHFLVDVLLQNYDLFGNVGNVAMQNTSGKAVRVDSGGSLSLFAFKAQAKETNYDCDNEAFMQRVDWRAKTWSHQPMALWDLPAFFTSRGASGYPGLPEDTLQELRRQFEELAMRREEMLEQFPPELAKERAVFDARFQCIGKLLAGDFLERHPILDAQGRPTVLSKRACHELKGVCRDPVAATGTALDRVLAMVGVNLER